MREHGSPVLVADPSRTLQGQDAPRSFDRESEQTIRVAFSDDADMSCGSLQLKCLHSTKSIQFSVAFPILFFPLREYFWVP